MDRYNSPQRPSGIPRPVSRIPLPTSYGAKSIKPSPSRDRLQADSGVNVARLRRPSQEVLRKPNVSSSTPVPRTVGGSVNRHATWLSPETCDEELGSFNDTNSTQGDTESLVSEDVETDMNGSVGFVNPSLSDRTVLTLSRVPPSPARGRRSSVLKGDIDSENTYYQLPANFSSLARGFGADDGRIATPSGRRRSQASLYSTSSRGLGTQSTRLSSTNDSTIGPKLSKKANVGSGKDQCLAEAKSDRRAETLPVRGAAFSERRGIVSRSTKPRPSLTNAFVPPTLDEKNPPYPFQVSKTRQPSSSRSSNVTSPISPVSKASAYTSSGSDAPAYEQVDSNQRRASKSSSALRESIAKAKAARKAARESSSGGVFDPWDTLEESDPFNQRPEETNLGLLRKRVDGGRTSGSLNIAALGLKEIPDEVLNMYELDPDSSTQWYESVDLVKFIAADNEIEELPTSAFPDIDPDDFDLEDDTKGNQFAGLEVLDLHGNLLHSLPIGLRRLQRLHTLNLSNNKLTMSDIEVISELSGLVELKIANNSLEGPFSLNPEGLSNVEVLDLHGNSLTGLPHGIAYMSRLKMLNVAENNLTELPFAALAQLPITELNAAQNKLSGCLIPGSVTHMSNLQNLNVVNNALDRLSENDDFELPNLQTLAVDGNRLRSLPSLTSWRSLLRLSAEGNCIKQLPQGFVTLDRLRHVDLTANDLSRLDEKIGLMDSLVTLHIANNPLRERKFLNMDTEDLKSDLRSRCAPVSTGRLTGNVSNEHEVPEDEDEEGSVTTEFTLAPESPSHLNRWKVKAGGILDRSSTDMSDLEADEVGPLLSSYDIRCLYIHHNKLQAFPAQALELLAHTLMDLDISNNPLGDRFIHTTISLPNLQTLTIKSSGIRSLDPLLENLSAPALKILDASNNRLTGPLPVIREVYHNLVTLLVADNQFSALEFEAVRGLQALDVTNNNIDFIPPKIGLLGVDGSGETGLRRFEIAGNSFRVPRWQIVAKGTQSVLEWLRGRIPAEELEKWDAEREAIPRNVG